MLMEFCNDFISSWVEAIRTARASSISLEDPNFPLDPIESLSSSRQRKTSSAGHDGTEPRSWINAFD